MKHYAMTSADSFRNAAGLDGGSTGGSISVVGPKVTDHHPKYQNNENPGKSSLVTFVDDSGSLPEAAESGRTKIRTWDLVVISDAL